MLHAEGAAFSRAAGGGGVVAVVLAELGADAVDFFCALGDDPHGHRAAEQLAQRGVTVHAAWRGSQPTRRALTLLEGSGERTIVTVGERLEPCGADELDWDLLEACAGAYFTAGDVAALEHARRASVLVASPRGRAALEQGPATDALVFSQRDRDEAAVGTPPGGQGEAVRRDPRRRRGRLVGRAGGKLVADRAGSAR